jgi:hypothetical protein
MSPTTPPPEPLVEQIAAALVAVLAAITVAAGYRTTVSGVVRPRRLEDHAAADSGIALMQDDPEEDGELESGAGGLKMWLQPFRIHCFLQISDADTTALDTRLNRFRSDVEKAIRANPTLGGLATDAIVRPPESWIFKPNRSFEGVTVNVEIHYRTLENDPYTQGG